MSFFNFKYFSIRQNHAALKVGTDSMLLGAFIQTHGKRKALDIGTGTGVLALMQAQKNPKLKITAIEISALSLKDAQVNISNSPFPMAIDLILGNFLQVDFTEKFDLIFSNPPFYSDGLKTKDLALNQAKHVDELPPSLLCEKVFYLLNENGHFWVIWPFETRLNFVLAATQSGLFLLEEIQLEGKPEKWVRSIFCFTTTKPETFKTRKFRIRNEDNRYSDEYLELTKDFHDREL